MAQVTKEQLELIEECAIRAEAHGFEKINTMMDLTYCIEGGCNLRLKEMLDAEDFNFLHDVAGINRHLDHNTHSLRGGFWPRFACK